MAFDEEEYLGHREQSDDGDKEIDTVHQVQIAARQARHAGIRVKPDHRDHQTDAGGSAALAWLFEEIPPSVEKARI